MHTKESLIAQLKRMDIGPTGTILIHSSMKSIGEVEGRADTVLDAFTEYMKEGLLIFPTHTWGVIGADNPKFYVDSTPSHIGILTELFRQRPGVIRSWHPTHSVSALGKDAAEFVKGNEQFDTPIARKSPWGKILDREAKILLVGVDLRRCTFIHGIEEWMDVPERLNDEHQALVTVLPDGTEIPVPSRRHVSGISDRYWKVEKLLAEKGAIQYTKLGDAKVMVCDTVLFTKYITAMLEIDIDLFGDNEPLSEEFVEEFRSLSFE